MANSVRKSNSRKKGVKNRQQAKNANRRMVIYFVSLVLLFFAATRLGAFGVLLYNFSRLLVGSTAYLAFFLGLVYLYISVFKKEIIKENRRLIPGISVIYWGIILLIQSFFVAKADNDTSLWNVLDDLGRFRVTKPGGGGFVGWFSYIPFKTIFSAGGVYIVAVLLILVGLYVAIPGLIDRTRQTFTDFLTGRREKKENKEISRKEAAAHAKKPDAPLRKEAFEEEPRTNQKQDGFDTISLSGNSEVLNNQANFSNAVEAAPNFDNYHFQSPQASPLGLITDENADWLDVAGDDAEDASSSESAWEKTSAVTDEDFEPETLEAPFEPEIEQTRASFGKGESVKFDSLEEGMTVNPLERAAALSAKPIFDSETEGSGDYQLPTSRLLTPIPQKDQSQEKARVETNSRIIEETLKSFKISAEVVSAVVGPSVTRYELKIGTGIKVSRMLNLSDDLALALAATDVRIEAPIPGKSLVGIEIPNGSVATVGFREMWESASTSAKNLLEVPLGKALDGSIRVFDLTKMPHLLVAGSTGSGKSVAVNGIITSILMKARPGQVKFLMVDPKMVELSVYNEIPHLLIPVVTNPRKASRALQKVVDEMESRYELFSRHRVRNIEGYNEKIEAENAKSQVKDLVLPLIVVIVDELADLMMVASKEVEDAIIRLGQKARAAGIHMILATQRPSVDVISGLIKANVPSRIAFAVSSGTDSRTILDANGAEKLLGRGDMLFSPIGENHPLRLQGAFLSDQDVESVVDFIREQKPADYDENFEPGEEEEEQTQNSEPSGDPLFDEAKNLIVSSQKASTAQLQRALRIGFNRATDLMNELESAGIVGPAKGTTPRKVLLSDNISAEQGDY